MSRFTLLHGVLALSAALLLGLAQPGRADTFVDVSAPNLFANGSTDVTISYSPTGLSERVAAGQFNLVATNTVSGVTSMIQAFCTDIFDWLKVPATYRVGLLARRERHDRLQPNERTVPGP